MSVVGTTFLGAINHCLKFHSHLPKSGICQFFPVKTTDKMYTYVFNVFKDIKYLSYLGGRTFYWMHLHNCVLT